MGRILLLKRCTIAQTRTKRHDNGVNLKVRLEGLPLGRQMHHRAIIGFTLLMLAACKPHSHAPHEPASNLTTKSFPTDGITKVVFRAAQIRSATLTTDAEQSAIQISGIPTGGAGGYHPSDPNWQETPAQSWGLDFVAQRHGAVLVISTKNEIGYMHHLYVLDDLHIRVPARVEVFRQERKLSGNGAPELGAP